MNGGATTAPIRGFCCRCGKEVEGQYRAKGLQRGVEHERWCHNGTYSRVLLPLRKKKDASRARYPMREFRQMSRVSSTGQWSEPKISLWIAAPRSLGCRRLDTRK